ncbi:hypothetical protein JW824_15235 [bacterium]|nr:hypothetical protein [bacterium]
MLIDDLSETTKGKPPKINNYIPDAIVIKTSQGSFIIGEAKTARDVEKKHTRNQIEAFLERCKKENDAIFIFAVPWNLIRIANSIVKEIQEKICAQNVKIIILERLYG